MKNRACFTVLCVCLIWMMSSASVLADIIPPPPPPIDIEKDATPGFTPSIESVLVRPTFGTEDEVRQQLRDWGPAAVPVLIRLYNDPAWNGFHFHIEYLISLSDAPEAVECLKRRFETLKTSDPSGSRDDFGSVCHSMARSNSPVLADLLFDGALNATGRVQGECISAIGGITSEKALSVLRQLAEEKRTDGVFTSLDSMIKDLEGRLRALRPMSGVLEKEAK